MLRGVCSSECGVLMPWTLLGGGRVCWEGAEMSRKQDQEV